MQVFKSRDMRHRVMSKCRVVMNRPIGGCDMRVLNSRDMRSCEVQMYRVVITCSMGGELRLTTLAVEVWGLGEAFLAVVRLVSLRACF